jgi:hypothetical protein
MMMRACLQAHDSCLSTNLWLLQVSDLRKQLTASDQELWRTQQELAALNKRGARVAAKRTTTAAVGGCLNGRFELL